MADRLTIYMGAPVAAALDGVGPGAAGRAGDPGSRSGRLNTICERYLAACRHDLPDLSPAEWNALSDCLNGTFIGEVEINVIWADLEDADRLDGLGEKWGIDVRALAARIRVMTFGQRVAIVEEIEQRWRRDQG